MIVCIKSAFLKRFWKSFLGFFITLKNYVNVELDKTEMLMNLKNRKLSMEFCYVIKKTLSKTLFIQAKTTTADGLWKVQKRSRQFW